MPNQNQPAQKRVGRPAKSPDGLPRVSASVRIRGEIRRRLIDAAKEGERSISEEIERRVERSFIRDELTRHIDNLLAESTTNAKEVGRAQERIAQLERENADLKARLQEVLRMPVAA